ncbi:thrombopoietin [Brachyistius frenatus]|uniref:thrombopoietin n=1 Tax=Brachyistius frenatus TaxID=100188 RepID=UPI0037E7C259
MAYSRLLLLLLIGVISTHLPEANARPIDFWCKNERRKKMMEMIVDKAECEGSDALPAPVQLPCVQVHAAEWANKTLPQKREEVLAALQVFQSGVQAVRKQITLQCHTSLLKRLEHSVANYLIIISTRQIQSDDSPFSHSAAQNCSSQTSLNKVLTQYRNLLIGKLERLAVDLQDTVCREEHTKVKNKGP